MGDHSSHGDYCFASDFWLWCKGPNCTTSSSAILFSLCNEDKSFSGYYAESILSNKSGDFSIEAPLLQRWLPKEIQIRLLAKQLMYMNRR